MQKNKAECQFLIHENQENIMTLYIKSDGSKFDFIKENKYLNISCDGKLIDSSSFPDVLKEKLSDGYYHQIRFIINQTIDADYLEEEFSRIIEKTKNKNKNTKYETILKDIIDYFETITSEKNLEKLRGDLGEALFILKCLELNLIKDIQKALKKREDEDNLDFVFDNNQTIEIKTTTKLKSEINLKLKQAKIENENCNIVIVKVNNYEKNKIDHNYLNILDIYNRIEKYTKLNNELNIKKNKYGNSLELVENNYININEATMHFINKKCIPIIHFNYIENDGALKDIILVLDACKLIDDENNFEKKLIDIATKI